jgi:hypothetical protein
LFLILGRFKQIREVQLKCYNFIFKNFREFQFREMVSIDLLMDIIYIFRAEKVSNAKYVRVFFVYLFLIIIILPPSPPPPLYAILMCRNQGQEMARKRSDNQLQKKMYHRQLSRQFSFNAFREISHSPVTMMPSTSTSAISTVATINATTTASNTNPANGATTTATLSTTASDANASTIARVRPTKPSHQDEGRLIFFFSYFVISFFFPFFLFVLVSREVYFPFLFIVFIVWPVLCYRLI